MELVLFLNVFFLSEKNKANIYAGLLILILCGYQTLEFLMCYAGLDSPVMAYFAFFDITFLPPLSLLFVATIFKINTKYFKLFFLPPIFFIVFYAFNIPHFEVVHCTVLYAAYNYPLGDLYGAFYYSPVIISMIILAKKLSSNTLEKRYAGILLTGHIVMSIPVITAFILKALDNYILLEGIESIMCKFAIVYAFCLSYLALKNKEQK